MARVDEATRQASAQAPTRATDPRLPAAAVVLLTALTAAVTAQGAFYGLGQRIAVAGLLAALVLSLRLPSRTGRRALAPIGCLALLAGWTVTSATAAGRLPDARPTAGVLAGMIAVLLVCGRLTASHRAALARGIVGVGVVVALTGWAGVAWRLQPWTILDWEFWRAATVFTYANAGAALLVAAALLAAGQLAEESSRPLALALCLLLAATGATLSRGGALGLAVGLAVLARLVGVRRLAAAVGPAVAGSVVVLLGLGPSLIGWERHPLAALVGLGLGLALTARLAASDTRTRVLAGVGATVLVALVVAVGAASHGMTSRRTTVASDDRVEEAQAAWRVFARHPVLGAGPGLTGFAWVGADGRLLIARFAHNEYLQMLAELGAVGLGLLAAAVVATTRLVRRSRPRALGVWAGAVAGLVALGVHSALDFLWHFPAIPLVIAALAGLAGGAPELDPDPDLSTELDKELL